MPDAAARVVSTRLFTRSSDSQERNWPVVKRIKPPSRINTERAATLMKALANENRLLILCELLDGERCVNEMEKVVGLSQSALSQHLALLRRDKLVNTRRDGKTICYSLSGRETPIVLEMLYRMFSPDERESDRNESRKRRGEKRVHS
jgi:DNA-binding transcriptional ArsR family regulator